MPTTRERQLAARRREAQEQIDNLRREIERIDVISNLTLAGQIILDESPDGTEGVSRKSLLSAIAGEVDDSVFSFRAMLREAVKKGEVEIHSRRVYPSARLFRQLGLA